MKMLRMNKIKLWYVKFENDINSNELDAYQDDFRKDNTCV